MTVLVGILCSDGVVIGSDSAITFSSSPFVKTIEQNTGIKVQIIGGKPIAATTGAVGLSQRFMSLLRGLHNTDKLKMTKPVDQAVAIAQAATDEFKKTLSSQQMQPQYGWGIGCLLGMVIQNKPELFEFDGSQFHPERKGDPDDGGKDRCPRIVSMGSGQSLADPFLGFLNDVFWMGEPPKVAGAKLAVEWTLEHAIKLNTGGIGGKAQIAVLERSGGTWSAHLADTGEIEGQVEDLKKHIRRYRDELITRANSPTADPKLNVPSKLT